jgi:hypothetical protein
MGSTDVGSEDELARGAEAPAAWLDTSSVPRFVATYFRMDGGDARVEDDLLGDRFWGRVQGLLGRLKTLRGRVRRAVELTELQGKRASKRSSLAV